jgi:hypothetical protein
VAVAGEHGSAIDGQTAHGGRDAAVAARRAGDPPSREGWWARLRKRGTVVAAATIAGAIATIIGTVVATCVWIGWTP